MKKGNKLVLLSLWFILLIVLLVMTTYINETDEEVTTIEPQIVKEEPQVLTVRTIEEYVDPIEKITQRMQQEMSDIEIIEDKKEWFIAYKDIINRYSKWFDPPEIVFDIFTEDEVKLICKAVETECYQQNFNSKANVASVIFNRIEANGEFGDTVEEIITNPRQFAYWRDEITEDTILAVMYSFEIKDTTNGCIAFRSGDKPEKWYTYKDKYWVKQFEDDSGHAFYK